MPIKSRLVPCSWDKRSSRTSGHLWPRRFLSMATSQARATVSILFPTPSQSCSTVCYRLVSRLGLRRRRCPNHAARVRQHKRQTFRCTEPRIFDPGCFALVVVTCAMLGIAKALVVFSADSHEIRLSGLPVQSCCRAVSSPVGPPMISLFDKGL